MRVIIVRRHPRVSPKTLSWWVEKTLLVAGLVCLVFWGGSTLNTRIFQMREKNILARTLRVDHSPREKPPLTLNNSDLIGEIEIPRIGISAVILEGSDDRSLRLGVGHIPGTALPGYVGNVSLAAHRDSFFRSLRNIRKNDDIHLIAFNTNYRYRVDWTRVVAPEDVSILKPSKEPTLTLVTCYPFYYLGSAPERFAVRAHRVPD